MLFLESPVGVGFSYSNTTSDYDQMGDDLTANDAYTFLHNWFLKFPSYRNRTFYIAGESYAGKYVPELAELIHDRNKDPSSLHSDLKGILLGNPETSDAEDWMGIVEYAWSHAVISDETHQTIKTSCDFNSSNPWHNEDCSEAVDEVLKQYHEIDMYSLYTSLCFASTANSNGQSMQTSMKRSSTTTMVDEATYKFNGHAPPFAKQLAYQAKGLIQKVTHEAEKVVNEGQSKGSRAGIDYVAKESKDLLLTSSVKLWTGLNHVPPFHAVAEMAVPTAAHLSEKYNHVIKGLTQKGYSVFGYVPLVPVEEISKAFKQGEVNLKSDGAASGEKKLE